MLPAKLTTAPAPSSEPLSTARVRECKWGRHVLSKRHLMSAGDKGSEDGAGGVVS